MDNRVWISSREICTTSRGFGVGDTLADFEGGMRQILRNRRGAIAATMGQILRYRRGAITGSAAFAGLVAAQVPASWALLAALGAGVLAEILPQAVDQYGWMKTGAALVTIVVFTALTIYIVATGLA